MESDHLSLLAVVGTDLQSSDSSTSPQVCDRCRIKKIGCDGILPKCGNCSAAKAECVVSVRLRRKTKPRRYVEPKDQMLKKLRADNQALREQLDAIATSNSVVAGSPRNVVLPEMPESHALQQRQPLQRHFESPIPAQIQHFETKASPQRLPMPIIKHLGRLVPTEFAVDRFAGTTTGVHFIHCAEQKYKQLFNCAEVFPQCVFRLHMLPQPKSLHKASTFQNHDFSQSFGLSKDRSYYLYKLERFFRRWGSIYPILAQKQFYEAFHRIMDHVDAGSQQLSDADVSNLHQIYLVLTIDAWEDVEDIGDPIPKTSTYYFDLARQTEMQTVRKGDMSCLQSMLLAAVFYQLSGQHNLLTQTSGSVVRLAQSLGLHRHSRRFKFHAGESEMRKRIWWCVYILDMTSSVSHGLPRLINDEDIDTELPFDCDFDDSTLKNLPLSLPGEATRFSNFLSYIRLVRIISATGRRLYTTTQRRGAVEKIQTLDRELRVWQHTFKSSLGSNTLHPYDNGDGQPEGSSSNHGFYVDDQIFFVPYLQLSSNISMLLIHQPALTFGSEFTQFEKSLSECVQCCMNIISILDTNRNERRIFYLQPSTARLIFQSALMCLYYCWHSPSSIPTGRILQNDAVIDVPLEKIINTAVSLLELQSTEMLESYRQESLQHLQYSSETLDSTITLLRTLASQTLQRSLSSDYRDFSVSPPSANGITIVSQQSTHNSSGEENIWGASALEELNQLGMLDWSTDYASESLDFVL